MFSPSPQWLPSLPFAFEFCIALCVSWILAGYFCSIRADKYKTIAAVGFFIGSLAPLLYLVSAQWQQGSELMVVASGMVWGPALACLAWSGLGLWPGLDKLNSLTLLPLIAMLLYLFRIVVSPSPGKELLAIYGPLMVLPLLLASTRGIKGVGFLTGLGAILLMLGFGGSFLAGHLIRELPLEIEWSSFSLMLGAILVGLGWIKYQKAELLS